MRVATHLFERADATVPRLVVAVHVSPAFRFVGVAAGVRHEPRSVQLHALGSHVLVRLFEVHGGILQLVRRSIKMLRDMSRQQSTPASLSLRTQYLADIFRKIVPSAK